MKQVQVEINGLDDSQTVSLTELSLCCEMSMAELDELIEYRALLPLSASAPEPVFSAEWVALLRAADKLRLEFDLDLFTLAILLGKLQRIEVLERQVRQLQALLPAHRR
ncbi:MAG: chaperone modulator CbpM [Rhodoferax sp.]|nr:chaperone modulator CbpM [Rhodoferax sp.]